MKNSNDDVVRIEDTLKEREGTHGSWEVQATLQTCLMSLLCGAREDTGEDYTPTQMACLQQITTKLSRIASGNANEPDHWLDISGYSTLQHKLEVKAEAVKALEPVFDWGKNVTEGLQEATVSSQQSALASTLAGLANQGEREAYLRGRKDLSAEYESETAINQDANYAGDPA